MMGKTPCLLRVCRCVQNIKPIILQWILLTMRARKKRIHRYNGTMPSMASGKASKGSDSLTEI